MTNTNTAAEVAILISMFAATHPRAVARAQTGCPNAIRCLELAAIKLEVEDTVRAAIVTLRDRGLSFGAIATTAHISSKRAKSDRARIILRSMARIACHAEDLEYQGDFE